MKGHNCGPRSVQLKHPFEVVAFIDVVFKAQPEEPIRLAPRGSAAVLCEDKGDDVKPHSTNGMANLIHFIARRQIREVRSTSSAELNGLVGGIEQMLLLPYIKHAAEQHSPRNV